MRRYLSLLGLAVWLLPATAQAYVAHTVAPGESLWQLGRKDEAGEIYRKGIEVAQRRGDQHARRELEAALSEVTPA